MCDVFCIAHITCLVGRKQNSFFSTVNRNVKCQVDVQSKHLCGLILVTRMLESQNRHSNINVSTTISCSGIKYIVNFNPLSSKIMILRFVYVYAKYQIFLNTFLSVSFLDLQTKIDSAPSLVLTLLPCGPNAHSNQWNIFALIICSNNPIPLNHQNCLLNISHVQP